MKNLTAICKRYTDVMAHKNYLQYVLFHANNVTVTISESLISIIIKLHVLAHNLQTAQVCIYICRLYCTLNYFCMYSMMQLKKIGQPCLTFTPCQYRIIYWSRSGLDLHETPHVLNLLGQKLCDWHNRTNICIEC